MDIKVLRYFETLCECRSIAKAAAELGITPQGLTSAVKRIQHELGERVVKQEGGTVAPTEYGRLLLELARDVNGSVDRFRRAFSAMQSHMHRLIKVGCVIGSIGYLGSGFFDSFNEERLGGDGPGAQVLVSAEVPDDELQAALLRGDYDFALALNPASDDLVKLQVVDDYSFFWVRDGDPLAGRKALSVDDLAGRRVIAYEITYGGYNPLVRLLAKSSIGVRPTFTGEMMLVYEQALRGRAVGLTARNHVEATEGTGVVGVPFPELPISYYLCWRSGRELTGDEQRLVGYIRSRRKIYPAPRL